MGNSAQKKIYVICRGTSVWQSVTCSRNSNDSSQGLEKQRKTRSRDINHGNIVDAKKKLFFSNSFVCSVILQNKTLFSGLNISTLHSFLPKMNESQKMSPANTCVRKFYYFIYYPLFSNIYSYSYKLHFLVLKSIWIVLLASSNNIGGIYLSSYISSPYKFVNKNSSEMRNAKHRCFLNCVI